VNISTGCYLTNNQKARFGELVFGHFQVERGGALANSTGGIVMGTMAWTVVTTEVTWK
jgi:hypothetical protein